MTDVFMAFHPVTATLSLALNLHDYNGGYLMPHPVACFMAASAFVLANSSSASAQRHEIPPLNSCIKEFYDPEMYNYLTFKNDCAQSLTVVLVAKDGSGAGGIMELRPGGKDSVGKSKGKDPKPGSFELYVCPTGYIPVDENNRMVSKPASNARCQLKGQ